MLDLKALRDQRAKAEQRAHLAREVVETLLLTGLIFFVVHFSIQSRPVTTLSMEPGLQPNQSIVVNSLAYLITPPHRGDVIVLHRHHLPTAPGKMPDGCSADSGTSGKFMTCDFVKRVIGVPGDTIQVTPIQIILNGVILKEPYIKVNPGEPPNAAVIGPIKLGTDQFFVLGDFRSNSADSRFWESPVLRHDIVGRVVMVFLPLNNLHWLPTYSSVYDAANK
ncbi:MAG TPA: signal peptidase I [Ktedonobacterales bacterium]|nr:signal peptidase I [Ktedonobacterales bacterium]